MTSSWTEGVRPSPRCHGNTDGSAGCRHNRNTYSNKNRSHLRHHDSLAFEFNSILSKKIWSQRMMNKSCWSLRTCSRPVLYLLPLRVFQCFHGPAERHRIIVSVAGVFFVHWHRHLRGGWCWQCTRENGHQVAMPISILVFFGQFLKIHELPVPRRQNWDTWYNFQCNILQ